MRKNNDEQQLRDAKRAYKEAKEVGNRAEEARWANYIGNIHKNRGEYVQALKWLRIDYDVSSNFLPDKQLLPTCNTLGELYLRLQDFKDALKIQKKHLQLAEDTNDLIEQQRASTQLGRTYHEMFMKSDDDHSSIKNAKKYFKSAMKLAKNLMKNPSSCKSTFVAEYVDAHNNIGMLEIDLDNLEEAQTILSRGLEICDEEELSENHDGRSRLHHNLGIVYMELRKWDKAREHMDEDISICNRIGHCQGEAKGYINLGELHYRVQKYDEAINCYHMALQRAESMEDEDVLVSQIEQNIKTVKAAINVMDEIKKEEQNLKRLARNMQLARGTAGERKCLLQQIASLDRLIEKSSMIFAWMKHLEYAKKRKKIANEICDKEKMGDSFLLIGESYQKLRKFKKALKWYTKSWETYNLIGNLEGQALSKIDIGNALDSNGNWMEAFKAFEEGYRIAVEAIMPSAQLSALENMHYSQMIRFDDVDKARSLKSLIDKLKHLTPKETQGQDMPNDCSETETEIDDLSLNPPEVRISPERSISNASRSKSLSANDLSENAPLISFLRNGKSAEKLRAVHDATVETAVKLPESSPRKASIASGSQAAGRKRIRLVLSDDESENDGEHTSRRTAYNFHAEEVATSNGCKSKSNLKSPVHELQDLSPVASRHAISTCTPVNLEESSCSHKSETSALAAQDAKDFRDPYRNKFDKSGNLNYKHNMSNLDPSACCAESCQHMIFKVNDDFVHLEPDSCMLGDELSMEQLKAGVACLYYLQLPSVKRAKGLVPDVQDLKRDGKVLETLEAVDELKNHTFGNNIFEVSLGVWVPKPVMKLYVDCCRELSEQPDLKVLKKLYNLEVSEDEVIVSDCGLQDISVAPLLNALHAHKTVAVIDLSHNLLGNGTMERLKQVFTSSGQDYGALVLDLHCNLLGPTALFQICECPVLYNRLEVLNVSGNRLTDACASYLSTILKKCKALYTLNVEKCSITSRTIQKIADSLDSGSVLAHLSLGHNNPISGNVIINLFVKICSLNRFQELNLTGIKLSKPVVDSLCQLATNSCLSGLILGGSYIGTDGALQLTKSLANETQELVKLDLSSCGLTCDYIIRLNIEVSLIYGILELNLGGNPLMQEGGKALASLVANPQCGLKVLVLSKCQLGPVGILRILEELACNSSLEELNLAENIHPESNASECCLIPLKEGSNFKQTNPNLPESLLEAYASKEVQGSPQELCTVNAEYNQLEVADSDDDTTGEKVAPSGLSDNPIDSSQKKELRLESSFIPDILAAISRAKHLLSLDLSDNGFCQSVAEKLYTAWSASSRAGLAQSHIQDNMIHLSVRGHKCCGVRPCCRRI
ncbi:protein TONSOKU-like [Coffea arabica]|uniref:Protein TONSOKU-like n=1 Tax=Coffea arabica TaxID=13443 RepID=A0ABM4VAW4_COFAR